MSSEIEIELQQTIATLEKQNKIKLRDLSKLLELASKVLDETIAECQKTHQELQASWKKRNRKGILYGHR